MPPSVGSLINRNVRLVRTVLNRSFSLARSYSTDTEWQNQTPPNMSHEHYRQSWIDAMKHKHGSQQVKPSNFNDMSHAQKLTRGYCLDSWKKKHKDD